MENLFIDSPLDGEPIALAEVDDKIFSRGSAGAGIAVKNPDGKIFAPFGSAVTFIASPGVIWLKSFDGVERRGQILLTFDPNEITRAGFDSTTPIVVTNPENFGDIIFALGGRKIFAQRGENFYAGKQIA